MSPRVVWSVAVAALAAVGVATWLLAPRSSRDSANPQGPSDVLDSVQGPELEEPVPALRRQVDEVAEAVETARPSYMGDVASFDGDPLANALVTLYAPGESWREQPPHGTAATCEDGSFEVAASSLDEAMLLVSAPGFLERAVGPVPPGDRVHVRLMMAAELYGRVLERESKEPVPRAIVTWYRETVETDAGGNYRFANVWADLGLTVQVRKEGFVPSEVRTQLQGGPNELDVLLDRGAGIQVTVIDAHTEAPLAGARVRKGPRDEPFAVTGQDGVFELRIAEDHQIYVLVEADGYAPFSWSWDVTDIGLFEAVRVPMIGLAWIDGIVVDAQGTPQQGVAIWANCDEFPAGRRGLDEEQKAQFNLLGYVEYRQNLDVETDELGHFTVECASSESEYFIDVRSEDHALVRVGPLVLAEPWERRNLEIVLTEGATIRGRVLRNTQPVSDAGIYWVNDSGVSDGAWSDEEGRFELTGIPAGEITVHINSEGGSRSGTDPISLSVEAGRVYERDFEWNEELANIAGRVTNQDGVPIEKVRLYASFDAGQEGYYSYEAQTGVDGSYSLEVALGRPYEIRAMRRTDHQRRRNVAPGTSGVDFVFADLGSLELMLVDGDSGEPIPIKDHDTWGMSWRVAGSGDTQAASMTPSHDGRVRLDLPIGLVDLSIYLCGEGYAPKAVLGVRVDRQSNGTPVVVELTRGAEAKIEVVGDSAFDRDVREGHAFFFLERSQLDFVRDPFSHQGGESNMRMGVNMWLADYGLMHQSPEFEGNTAELRGLMPGTYTLRAFPDDLVFEPMEMEVVGPRTELEVRWSRR